MHPVSQKIRQKASAYGYHQRSGTDGVNQSARLIVPLIVERFHPSSVIDVGCGVGDWLEQFAAHGVHDIYGYDGSWVPVQNFKIHEKFFQQIDMYEEFPQTRRVDLAVCLEVVKHVADEVGRRLVSFLCASADVVVWSAAVPGQGGYGHINERSQDYWVKIFAGHGFEGYDLIRPQIWDEQRIAPYYRQNILIFGNAAGQKKHGLTFAPYIAAIVHPEILAMRCNPKNYSRKTL
jgi:SAM-dependent methyltransferase